MRPRFLARCSVFASAMVLVAGTTSWANTPLLLNQHPRIGMNRADLPAIVSRLGSGGEWNGDFQNYVRYLESSEVWQSTSRAWGDLAMWSMGAAFVYTVRTQSGCCSGVSFSKSAPEYAAKARSWALSLISLDTTPPNYLGEHAYHSTFYVYDWIHDTLDSNAKAGFINYWKTIDTYAALAGAESGNRQWANEQLSRGAARKVLAGLVCYGDGIDDAWCQTSYQKYGLYIRHAADGMVTRETQRGGTDGSWIQGINYGLSYDAHHLAIAEMGWRTANGIAKPAHYTPSDAGYWLGLGRLATYFTRPWAVSSSGSPDGRHWRYLKDVYTNKDFTPNQASEDLVWWGLMRRELQGVDDDAAALAAWNIAHRAYSGGTDPRYWIHTKFLGARNAEKDPATIGMPLNKAFRFGAWMWRTGWRNINDALVTVFGYEFSGFRSAVGSFSIDYMGPAIIVPGSGGHDFDSAWHGFANTLGAPENRSTPETNDPENNDDYGYHRTYNPITPNFVQNTVADWLDRTERFFAGDSTADYGYLRLDRTRSMNSVIVSDQTHVGNQTKIRNAIREFAVFPPDNPGTDPLRVVISDRMTTLDTRFEKRWTLYYSGTPVVDGSPTPGPARGNPSTAEGKTTYLGATTISAVTGEPTGGNKVWVRPIFPANPRVVLVNFRRDNKVEDPYGLLHGTSTFPVEDAPYVGSYRTEIIPSTPQLTDHFVNVVEVTTRNGNSSTTEAINGVNFKGARVGDRIAVFGTTDLPPNGSFVIPTAGTYRVVIAGFGPSATRTVTAGGNITSMSNAATGGGVTFTSTPQGVLYASVTVAASGTGAANTITLGTASASGNPPQAPGGVRIVPGAP